MWIFSKHRSEHDNRFVINLDLCSRINLTPLGEKWFVEVTLGSETIPIAQVGSQEEASDILHQIFACLQAGEKAIDLDLDPDQRNEQRRTSQPSQEPTEKLRRSEQPARQP